MSFELKNYQRHVLRQLREFLHLARIHGAAQAYRTVIERSHNDEFGYENPYARKYRPLVDALDCPHVCIRVPTAGGKTYLAAHAIGHGAAYMETENPTVLWFTPTDAIRAQTAAMLKNRNHPCRIAIENRFGFDVAVYDIEKFDMIRPQDFDGRVCIIVSTAQMFARKETSRRGDDGMSKATRRIYATHENFEAHFGRFMPSPPPATLDCEEDGAPKLSFANLLHLTRPLVILDEAHRFVSDLSREVLQRINPACVLEWTATPRAKPGDAQPLHNVLVNIPAQALYAEQMVKLPVVVSEHADWERAVSGAIAGRRHLAKIAADSGESIRPIVLYQAQDEDEEVTVQKLKAHLLAAHNVDEDAIAIHTGKIKELDAAGDLLAPGCKIEHVITIKALVEGWDCPFAYVLCTLSNVASRTGIEQLLGRVMRMPDARHREQKDLNRAYAHVPEQTPFAAAECLREKLADELGFEEKETTWAVQESALIDGSVDGGGFIGVKEYVVETERPPDFSQLPEEARAAAEAAVEVRSTGAVYEVAMKAPLPPDALEAVVVAVEKTKRDAERRRVRVENQRLAIARAPAHCGKKLAPMPSLFFHSSAEGKEVIVNADTLYEVAQWNDLGDDCLLGDFSIHETAQTIEIFLSGGKVSYGKGRQYQLPLAETAHAPGEKFLANWLEKKIRDPRGRYFPETLKKLVNINLDALRKVHPQETLARAKYQLAEALKERLARHAREIGERVVQECLLDNETLRCRPFFEFLAHDYRHNDNVYSGNFAFQKHYYPVIGDLKSDGEEFDCARVIDSSEHVDCWIRNLPKSGYSIPAGIDGNFYPDFVVLLKNGARLIIEYKGKHLAENPDSILKKRMGEFVENNSADCFFLMATVRDGQPGIEAQIGGKIDEILRAGN